MGYRYLLLGIIFINSYVVCIAQQDPQFTHYLFNQNYLNPATTGQEETPNIQFIYRSQYIGYSGNFDASGTLNTQYLSYQMPLKTAGSGVGIVLVNDAVGAQNNQNIKLSYARALKIGTGKFTVGMSAGVYNKSFNNNLRPREAGDNNVPSGISQIKPDIGLGLYYDASDYFLGIAVNHLTNPSFNYGTNNGKSVLNRSVSALVGAALKADNIIIKPTILIRSDLQTMTYETGLLGYYKNKYFLGGNYRNQDAVSVLAGLSIMPENALKLSFAYDLITSNRVIKTPSSAEVMITYALGSRIKKDKIPAKNPIMRTPRYRH